MAVFGRFPSPTRACGSGNLDTAGKCLRASFACPDHSCPEMNGLLIRLFAVPPQEAAPDLHG